jgi:short-subunit dehydrogenase
MEDLINKVAVITGAASGIGKSIAKKCALEGMNLVLVDINKERLRETELEIKNLTENVLALKINVSDRNDIELLARKCLEKYGKVHILFNNAGISIGGPIWEKSEEEWKSVFGVNINSIFYAVKTFIPIMLKQDTECLIINTSSGFGLIADGGIYGVTKHAVTAFSEILSYELFQIKSKIKIKVIIPGFTLTNIGDTEIGKLSSLDYEKMPYKARELLKRQIKYREMMFSRALNPDDVAESVIRGIKDDKFYLIHDPYLKIYVKRRFRRILSALRTQYIYNKKHEKKQC